MPKINQEEYEILKKIDDGYKWIARDEDRGLYAFTKKPVRKDGYSSYWRVAELEDPYTALGLFDEIHLFQFIQWENNEPYNIVELIEDYESEETEVKKNIEWLKEKVQKRIDKLPGTYSGLYIEGSRDAYHLALKDIDQLDEPEVLSDKWIDDNSVYASSDGVTEEYVHVDVLKEILVPKQEKVKRAQIPRWIIKWYQGANNEFSTLEDVFSNLSHDTGYNIMDSEKFRSRIMKYGGFSKMYEALSHIYFGVYEIEEEEPKYYVYLGDGQYLVSEDELKKPYVKIRHEEDSGFANNVLTFTEQEIKDYDPRYWAFRKQVEELEE